MTQDKERKKEGEEEKMTQNKGRKGEGERKRGRGGREGHGTTTTALSSK